MQDEPQSPYSPNNRSNNAYFEIETFFLIYVLHFVTMILKQTLLDLLYYHTYVDLIISQKQEGESNFVDPMEMFQAFAILF